VDEVHPNPEQPRVDFDEIEIASLAESIEEQGLVQPIVVAESEDGYTLIDGERRLRAVKSLGLACIKAVVHGFEEKPADKLAQAVVANLQRADLNPIEEGRAFKRLNDSGVTLATIAMMVGRSLTHVSFRIKLLEFEPEIQELIAMKKLPIDPNAMYKMFELPSDIRVRMLRNFAVKGTSTAVIRRTVTKYLDRAELPDVPLSGRKRSPAAIMSDVPEENRMMALVGTGGGLPEWDLINQAAAETCGDCTLNNMASAQMCKDCPAVELLKRLNRIVGEQK
jgi:ParB family chromosome partitioning protein